MPEQEEPIGDMLLLRRIKFPKSSALSKSTEGLKNRPTRNLLSDFKTSVEAGVTNVGKGIDRLHHVKKHNDLIKQVTDEFLKRKLNIKKGRCVLRLNAILELSVDDMMNLDIKVLH